MDRLPISVFRARIDRNSDIYELNHPDTIVLIAQMGRVFEYQRKLNEAEKSYRHAHQLSVETNGPNHPLTIELVVELTGFLHTKGKLDEAEDLLQDVLNYSEYKNALNDPHVISLKLWMAKIKEDQGEWDKSEALLDAAFSEYKETYGLYHPDTLSVVAGMADLLKEQGKLTEAERFFQLALDGHEEIYGPNHPTTLNSKGNLGHCLMLQKDFLLGRKMVVGAFNQLQEGPNGITISHPWYKKFNEILNNAGELAEIDEKIAHQVQVESAENLPMGNTGEWQASLDQYIDDDVSVEHQMAKIDDDESKK